MLKKISDFYNHITLIQKNISKNSDMKLGITLYPCASDLNPIEIRSHNKVVIKNTFFSR